MDRGGRRAVRSRRWSVAIGAVLLVGAFEAVDEEYGSIEAYAADGLGLDDATLDALRENLPTADQPAT